LTEYYLDDPSDFLEQCGYVLHEAHNRDQQGEIKLTITKRQSLSNCLANKDVPCLCDLCHISGRFDAYSDPEWS